jgi:methylglutaconyl-CoA hydratase
VLHITLSRPDRKNALDGPTALGLANALEQARSDPEIRVVLLDAQGEDFCAGADLGALRALVGAGAAAHREDARALGDVFLAMRRLHKPVVAAVRGRALAGGAGLATACDLVLAHENASFGYPEVRIGFVPAMVMTMLRRSVGEKRAFELVSTGRTVSAAEALAMGLVSHVLAGPEFESEVSRLVSQLAAAPPQALGFTKKLFYDLDDLSFADGISAAVEVNVSARATEEFREGLDRFLDRRSAKGRS